MLPARPRHAFSVLVLLLGTATALGLAGCADGTSSDGSVKSLSGLPNKGGGSMLRVAEASRQAGDCSAALRFYRLAVDKEKKPADIAAARVGAGECELSLGAMPEARQDYLAAMKLAPEDPAPLVGLGRIFLIEHKPGEAASYLDLAIKKGATAAYVWNDKGVALDQLRRHKEAQQAYRQGLTDYANDRALRNNLALSLAMSREFPEAESLLRTLASEPDATARTRQNLALVLGLEGDDAGARRVAAADLDGAALDNNEHFFDYVRALVSGMPLPAPTAAFVGRSKPRFAQAEPASALPNPAWVEKATLPGSAAATTLKFRAPEPENFAAAPNGLAVPKQSADVSAAPTSLLPGDGDATEAAAPVASSEKQ